MVLALSGPENIVNYMAFGFTKPQNRVKYMVLALSEPTSIGVLASQGHKTPIKIHGFGLIKPQKH